VRMMQRDTHRLAFILKNEYVIYKIEAVQLGKPVPPRFDQFMYFFNGLGGKGCVVIWGIKEYFANPLIGSHLIHSVGLDSRNVGFSFETGEQVLERDDIVIRFGNLSGEVARLCRAKRAKVRRRQEGPVLPLRSCGQPLAEERVVSEFRH